MKRWRRSETGSVGHAIPECDRGKPAMQPTRPSQSTLTPADLVPAWRAAGAQGRQTLPSSSVPRGCRCNIDLAVPALYIRASLRNPWRMPDIEEIIDNFAVLDDWDDRYRYLIELGRELPPLAEARAERRQ